MGDSGAGVLERGVALPTGRAGVRPRPGTMTMPQRETHQRMAYAIVAVLLVALHGALTRGPAANAVYSAGIFLATVAVVAGIRRNRPTYVGPWRLLALGFVIAALTSMVDGVLRLLELPRTGVAIGFLTAWAMCMTAAWMVTRKRTPRGEFGTALDTAIVTTGAAVLLHVFVVQPTWDATQGGSLQRLIAVIYPLLGLAALAVLSRLAFGGCARVPAFWYVATGLLHFLAADLLHALFLLQGVPMDTGVDAVRLLGFLLLGAGTLQPSIDRLTDEADQERLRLSRPRLLALWAASVAVPLTLLGRTGFRGGNELPVIAFGSIALFSLVVARMWRLLGSHARLLRREHEDRFRALVEHAEDVIALIDDADQAVYVSTSVRRTFGYAPEAVLGRGGLVLDRPTWDTLRHNLAELRAGDGTRPVRMSGRVQHADGGWRRAEAVLVDRRRDPAIGRIVITVRDVTSQWELEQELTHQAFHDALTGLPNRALFVDRARQALDVRRADDRRCSVLFLDVDDFKTVNDGLGHDQGDALLQVTARRLSEVVRGEDTVARLGGDEFAILVPRGSEPTVVTALAERILHAVAAPIALGGRELSPNASVGIAIADGHTTVDELLRDADAAMYVAKREGKGTFRLFDPEMHAEAMHRLRLRTELFGALDREELFVVYHGIHDLETGQVAGVEALLRWQHPTLGLVPPSEFIPIAEESGRIGDLGAFVLRRACREVQALRDAGHPELFLTVNVSSLQLERTGFVDEVTAALVDSGLPAAALVLELTERVLLEESEAVADALARLRATGLRLAIDDFGTGYCSLAYLTRLPFDIIKVDQSFVALLDDPAADHRVTVGILELIGSLAVPAVAEGIETPRQLDRLRALGCRYGQGFLWAEPVPANQLAWPASVPAAGRA